MVGILRLECRSSSVWIRWPCSVCAMHGRERSKACSPLRSSSPRMLAGRRQCNPAQKVTSEVADHVDSAGSPGPRSFCMCIGALGDSSHDTSCHLHYLAVGTLHTSPALQGLVLVSLALAQGLLPLSLYQGLLHRNRGLGVCHEGRPKSQQKAKDFEAT